MHTNAEDLCGFKLRCQKVSGSLWKYIMVIEARRTAVSHQLGHSGAGAQKDGVFVEILPDAVQRFEPVEQLVILHLAEISGKVLIQMMMYVDKSRVNDHIGAIIFFVRFTIKPSDPDDLTVLKPEIRMTENTVEYITGYDRIDVFQSCQHFGLTSV